MATNRDQEIIPFSVNLFNGSIMIRNYNNRTLSVSLLHLDTVRNWLGKLVFINSGRDWPFFCALLTVKWNLDDGKKITRFCVER